MLTRLDRYLLREVAQTSVAVTGVLLVILLSNQLARVLGQAAQAEFPGSVVVTLIGLTTLQQLTVLVPVGLFLGIVLALGRLYHESEMTAMSACGVGPLSIYRPIALFTLLVVGLLAALSFRVVPEAGARVQQIRAEALRLSRMPYVEAARAMGASRARVLLVHVLPGALAPALATLPYVLGGAVLLEASLSFLGLGTPPPTASWGRALADARESLATAWWCVAPPAAALFLFVLSARKAGEALAESR